MAPRIWASGYRGIGISIAGAALVPIHRYRDDVCLKARDLPRQIARR
ncbi:MAG TPA: hypothetical protein VJA94_05465 [Candidatus Angelobacter sp.]